MKIKMPRARVKYVHPVTRSDRAHLTDLLREKFVASKYETKDYGMVPPFFEVNIDGRCFSFRVDRDRYRGNFAVVSVVPLVSTFFPVTRKDVPPEFIPGLKLICINIDKFLRFMSCIESIYWYFEWGNYRSDTVNAPAGLPWEESDTDLGLQSNNTR